MLAREGSGEILFVDTREDDSHLSNEPLGPVDKEVPGPVAEEQIFLDFEPSQACCQGLCQKYLHVSLHDWYHVPLVDQLFVLHPSDESSSQALDVVQDRLDAVLSHLLQAAHG